MAGQWGPPAPYGQQPWQPAPTPQSAMRAANSDRERTIDVLKAAFAEGRLTAAEYEHRMSATHQAATYGQLAALVADLPSGPMVQPFGAPVPVVPPTFMPAFLPPPPARNNGLAVASATLGCLTMPVSGFISIISGVPGLIALGLAGTSAVVTGHMARAQLRTTKEDGDGLAVLGLILGWLSVAAMLLAVLIVTAR
ncbi:DUF1707 and DUF4190 domain-containing protein [Kitasatospora sp. YST-16]|uniref:DUF1707 and DUF4190 domain-containing protein n=1 Tax=Kitasatospora sp. YST-16 TaxID=2998080 RepID=UPI0022847494|nr:DUF1707 and DUF4190 domain-containing protein [Kitasatospora sp. YST-16]WAL72273.1 DUF1707 and DUF4190 domain-containing protein [Kitasatospora sp. YST-16]WNW38319.1 DUF1707 and DUF4190 domain-containing protein [Streptomyces sp. Li-HN-5-13]